MEDIRLLFTDLCIYCKNPIAGGNLKWIFACNCAGTEQLQGFYIWGQVTWLSI